MTTPTARPPSSPSRATAAAARILAAPPPPAVLTALRARIAHDYEIADDAATLLSATTEDVLIAQAQRIRELTGRPRLTTQ